MTVTSASNSPAPAGSAPVGEPASKIETSEPTLDQKQQARFTKALGYCTKFIGYFIQKEIIAAGIGAVGAIVAGVAVFSATQYYQENDGRQKALNDYTTGMKELMASTNIDRKAPQRVAALQYAKTLLVMRELDGDGDRKGQALRFLHETCLITTQEVTQRCLELKNILPKGGEKIDLRGVNLNGIDLKDTWIPYVNLREAYMKGANLQNADLTGVDLTDAVLAATPKSNFQDAWLDVLLRPNNIGMLFFSKSSNLQKAKLKSAIFDHAELTDVDFREAQLFQARFVSANLLRANLRGADLRNADLSSADLRGADLRDANLTNAKLDGACYVEGEETQYFSPDFDPKQHNMVALPENNSDLNKPNDFKPCPSKTSS